MSILTEKLPDSITAGDISVKIHTDFRLYIKAMSMLKSKKKTSFVEIINMLITEPYKLNKNNINECVAGLMEFISHSKANTNADRNAKKTAECFDFEYDAERIYSAFFQQYNIDLSKCNMHWWTFKALFDGLSEDTQFVKVMQYRTMDISKIKDKEQKEFYRKKKELYRIPVDKSVSKEDEELIKILSGDGNMSKFLGGDE